MWVHACARVCTRVHVRLGSVCDVHQVLVAANLDPGALAMVGERLDRMLDDRNRMIRDLQYSVARVTKAHNDALRVYESKLHELGVAAEETGFAPLMTATSVGPAGLVAAPTFPRAA